MEEFKIYNLIQNEIIFIRKNHNRIMNNANVLYKQKLENDTTAGYVKSALPYKEIEELCKRYGVSGYSNNK